MNDDSSTDPELSSLVVGFFSTKKNKQTKKKLGYSLSRILNDKER